MKKIPGLFKLASNDIIKGAIMAVISAIVTGVTELLSGLAAVPPIVPTAHVFVHMGIVALISGLSYITKNFFTNSSDQFAKKEANPNV